VLWAHRVERFQHNQIERALQNFSGWRRHEPNSFRSSTGAYNYSC
jgi:hypothetical protein